MLDENLDSNVIIIHSYQPTLELLKLSSALLKGGASKIVVVDDGSLYNVKSKDELNNYISILSKLSKQPFITVLRHKINMGKGESLKTAFNHVMTRMKGIKSVITVDSDYHHSPSDVLSIIKNGLKNNNAIIIGSRNFDEDFPFKSRVGNSLTKQLLSLVVGGSVSDTQSGLRYIPVKYIPEIMKLKSGGFDFELDMIIYAIKNNITLKENVIKTIYHDGNKGTHFNPFFDSLKDCFLLARFSIVSILTSAIDFAVFSVMFMFFQSIIISLPAGRLVSGIFNFTCNKKLTFKSNGSIISEVFKYLFLILIMMTISYGLILVCVNIFGLNVFVSKLVVDLALFLFSFSTQKVFVFK